MHSLITNCSTLPAAVMKSSRVTDLRLVSGSDQPEKSVLYPGLKPDGQRSQKLEDNDDTDLLVTFPKWQVDNIECVLKNGSATNACLFWQALVLPKRHAALQSSARTSAAHYCFQRADFHQPPVSSLPFDTWDT